jgi:hypothetical protein
MTGSLGSGVPGASHPAVTRDARCGRRLLAEQGLCQQAPLQHSSYVSDLVSHPNAKAHLPRPLVRPYTPKRLNAAPVRCNGWLAPALPTIRDPKSGTESPCHSINVRSKSCDLTSAKSGENEGGDSRGLPRPVFQAEQRAETPAGSQVESPPKRADFSCQGVVVRDDHRAV